MDSIDRRHEDRRRARDDQRVALGRLTEGVAHVVRNPLTGIGAGVELLGRLGPSDPLTLENVAAILREVDRVNDLLEEMLRITHPPRLAPSPADVGGLLRQVAGAVGRDRAGRQVDVSVSDLPGTPRLDSEQLRTALLELLRNASEAAGAAGEVKLSAAFVPASGDGGGLRIMVENSGPGFPDSIRAHAFEPFRSTKPGRKGLGLYIANDIIERHGGELRLEAPPAGGARVTVDLPWETEHDDRD